MKNKLCDVAWNLRKAREAKNFTQEYLAVQLDISATAYRNIENRHTQVSVRRLYEIANVLDISVVELLELSDQLKHSGPEAGTPERSAGTEPFLLTEKKQLEELTRQLADLVRRLSKQKRGKKRQ
ncbi:helix-turn-helix transcriptional regulator [Rurimicrobium arvi]|uniref:HTH cro/C1-type domain-containing protein n=1 Tax=Rurimicrobium arvi TaxID=2049916 RepID=A0ABP8MR99_9BACT